MAYDLRKLNGIARKKQYKYGGVMRKKGTGYPHQVEKSLVRVFSGPVWVVFAYDSVRVRPPSTRMLVPVI